jgi:hypothetical protein
MVPDAKTNLVSKIGGTGHRYPAPQREPDIVDVREEDVSGARERSRQDITRSLHGQRRVDK